MTRQVQFGNSKILYKVKRTDRKKTSQIIVDRKGVQVVVPRGKTLKEIQDLIQSNSKWIYQKQLEKSSNTLHKLEQKQLRLLYRGKYYKVKIRTGTKASITLRNGKFQLRLVRNTPSEIRNLYQNWLRTQALKIIPKQLNLIFKGMGMSPNGLHVKTLKERWGSLSKDGSININVNLLKAPNKILDYIIIHELCHLRIPNHSVRYWSLVHKLVPDYESCKKWLERHEANLL